eukprot:TRINITY_DN9087_c0_g1_i1.p1 TRINITY_DN9087_c0_g1~~TRINITY_DN9087_c0_g1_i1.p1  ORF type:complete len:490 (+),score=252.47 TRINITY_DN9087_c0_g1_i1:46-1470(+)
MSGFDYGDGGAFPEIHRPQFPLDMGRPGKKSNALAVAADSKGTLTNTALVRQGRRENETVYSNYKDLVPKQLHDEALARPAESEVEDALTKARKALEAKIQAKLTGAKPTNVKQVEGGAQYLRYTPSNTASGAPQVKNRMVKMVQQQVDPLEPAKFRIKRVPAGPPSPTAPVLHSPQKKLSAKDMADFKVPACVSNWKNPKGYTVPLEQRVRADGRGLIDAPLGEKHAMLATAIGAQEKLLRERVEMRNQLAKKVASKKKEKEEEELRDLAMRYRDQKEQLLDERTQEGRSKEEIMEERRRNEVREERRQQWEHERRISERKGQGRGVLDKEVDRDLQETMALGGAQPTFDSSTYIDQRLFNQEKTRSLDDVDGDGALFTKSTFSHYDRTEKTYRPTREALDDEHLRQAGQAEGRQIEFEGGSKQAADPFDMDAILDDVKQTSFRPGLQDSGRDSGRKRRRSSSEDYRDKRSKR